MIKFCWLIIDPSVLLRLRSHLPFFRILKDWNVIATKGLIRVFFDVALCAYYFLKTIRHDRSASLVQMNSCFAFEREWSGAFCRQNVFYIVIKRHETPHDDDARHQSALANGSDEIAVK